MPSPNNGLTVGQVLALGALQGPAELLPISSSAHTAALSWLMGWPYDELDPDMSKSFEVALHTGGTLALLLATRDELRHALRPLDQRCLIVLAAASTPAMVMGFALGPQIERKLGTPRTIAVALLSGAAAMAVVDRRPEEREFHDAGLRDGIWLGLAQASALAPGVSRAGATLAVARMLRFTRTDAKLLSDRVALPVLVGASALKTVKLARRGLDSRTAVRFALGAGASFASTLALISNPARRGTSSPLLPYAIYRTVLASWMLSRSRRG